MKRSRLWLLALLPLGIAVCGGGDTQDGAAVEDTTQAGTVATAPATTPQEPLPEGNVSGPGTGTAMAPTAGGVMMNAVNNSGVSGAIVLAERGGAPVMVRLMGVQGPGTLQGYVHGGSCENLGGVVAPLEPITVDNTGMGSSTSNVNLALGALTDGNHVVSYHQPGGNPGAPVVCGVLQ